MTNFNKAEVKDSSKFKEKNLPHLCRKSCPLRGDGAVDFVCYAEK